MSERTPLLQERTGTPSRESQTESSETPKELPRRDFIWITVATWSAVFLGSVDLTIVATLTSPIGSYFNASNKAAYLGTSYLLSVCCFTPLYGRLADILGRKGAMILALSLFGLGTLLCGLAPSMDALIAARAIAGMGGGGILTVSSIIISDLIPLRKRGLYQGIYNIIFGVGSGLGGPLGGFISDTLGWRSAFLLQIPLLAFSYLLILSKFNLPTKSDETTWRQKLALIDWFGTITLVTTVASLLVAVTLKTAEEMPWSHPLVWGLFVLSGVSTIAFVLIETYVSLQPIMPLRLLKHRTVASVCLSNFFISVMAYSMLYNVPLYFMAVRLQTTSEAGGHLLPNSIFVSIGSLSAGWLIRSTGKHWTISIIAGLLATLGNTLMALWNSRTSAFELWFDIIPVGFGMSSMVTSTLIALISSVDRSDMAVATGLNYLFRTTGQVLGVSFSGAIAQSILRNELREKIHIPNAEEVIGQIRHSTEVIRTLDPELKAAAVSSWAIALKAVFIFNASMAFLSVISSLPIQEFEIPSIVKGSSQSTPEPSATRANGDAEH